MLDRRLDGGGGGKPVTTSPSESSTPVGTGTTLASTKRTPGPSKYSIQRYFEPKDYNLMFNVSRFSIKMDDQETRVIAMICLLFSFTQAQLKELQLLGPDDEFTIQCVDSLQ